MHPWERVGWAFVEQWTLDFSLFLQYHITDLEIKEMWPAQGEGVLVRTSPVFLMSAPEVVPVIEPILQLRKVRPLPQIT